MYRLIFKFSLNNCHKINYLESRLLQKKLYRTLDRQFSVKVILSPSHHEPL